MKFDMLMSSCILNSKAICAQGSICFELAKGFPAFSVAIAVAIVTWRQYLVSKAKLNLDLYKERYEIFEETWGFLSNPSTSTNALGYSPKFTNLIPRAEFLFGKEIGEYMRTISSKVTQMKMIDLRTSASNNIMQSEDIRTYTQLSNWINLEAISGAKEKFGKYLNFSEWHG